MQEIWKDIEDYEGLYQVSNLGNVKSLPKTRNIGFSNAKEYISKDRILKTGGKRYEIVVLYKNKKTKTYPVHKLVAEHFLENPNNYPCVNHIDGNKKNNKIDNLEFCTISQNTKRAYDLGLKKAVNRYTKNKCS